VSVQAIVTHEVTYESLPYATRARLNEQLACCLEKSFHPRVNCSASLSRMVNDQYQ
jgi:hypothetical protein